MEGTLFMLHQYSRCWLEFFRITQGENFFGGGKLNVAHMISHGYTKGHTIRNHAHLHHVLQWWLPKVDFDYHQNSIAVVNTCWVPLCKYQYFFRALLPMAPKKAIVTTLVTSR